MPIGGRPGPEPAPHGLGWTLRVTTILANPRYTGRQVWNRQRTHTELADPGDMRLGHKRCSGGTCPAAG